ncbi:MAG: L,D-transpeptidase family protein [Clostridia bacterium]|nr:L,D-transpeptidase family protein [Clostridia bacterium]
MKDKQEKASRGIKNSTKWGIFVGIFLVSLILLTMIGVTNNINEAKQVSSEQAIVKNNENIQENEEIGNLEQTQNKTEEELQEINKREMEKAEQKEKEKEAKDQKQNKTNSNKTTAKPKNKYYIKVNYGAQVVNIYTYDKNGKYTVPVKAFVCSTGTETPRSGVYKIPAKITWCRMYGDVWGHYCSQIVGNILFHSVPYLERNNHTLEYWAYDQLGTKASMGCIRLTTRDAKWIYDNISIGTSVEFYSSSNPGPLGKPSAKKISNAPGNLKWWDPTDPDPKNPWRNYKPSNNTNTNKNNQTTNNVTNNVQNNPKPSTNNQVNNTTNNIVNNSTGNIENTSNNVINNSQENNTIVNDVVENNEMVNEQI